MEIQRTTAYQDVYPYETLVKGSVINQDARYIKDLRTNNLLHAYITQCKDKLRTYIDIKSEIKVKINKYYKTILVLGDVSSGTNTEWTLTHKYKEFFNFLTFY